MANMTLLRCVSTDYHYHAFGTIDKKVQIQEHSKKELIQLAFLSSIPSQTSVDEFNTP